MNQIHSDHIELSDYTNQLYIHRFLKHFISLCLEYAISRTMAPPPKLLFPVNSLTLLLNCLVAIYILSFLSNFGNEQYICIYLL